MIANKSGCGVARAALILAMSAVAAASLSGQNCNPSTGICGKCVNCGPEPAPPHHDRPEPPINPTPPAPPPGPTQADIQRMQAEQARRQAAEAALQKARDAMNQGDLPGAIQFLEVALRNQPENHDLQGQLQRVQALKDAETQERIDALKRETAAMEAEQARLAAEQQAAQVRLDAALRALGPKITPGTAFRQLQEAAGQGRSGKLQSDNGAVLTLQAPWDKGGPLPLPVLPVTLSGTPQLTRPEDRAKYEQFEQERTRLQGEYQVLEQKLAVTTDPVAQYTIKNEMTHKKSEIDTVVVKMLDLSYHLDENSPPEQTPPPPPPPSPGKEKE